MTPFVADRIYRTLIGAETDGMPTSVHLTRFPEPDPGLVRPDLDAAVDVVRRAVTLGLAVRHAAGVRVRQPLARAVVQAPAPLLAGLPAFAADLADELNVETVEHAAVDGGAPAGDVTVALDLALTEGLRRTGLVRQLVHQIQLLRKSAGLEVDDRIRLVVTAGAEGRDAFEEHRAYICAETLAVEMSFGAPAPGFVSRDARLAGGPVTLALARAHRLVDEGGARKKSATASTPATSSFTTPPTRAAPTSTTWL